LTAPQPPEVVSLRLYVAGSNLLSRRAQENLQALLAETPAGAFELEVVDLLAEPERADDHRVLATPTLVRMSPAPVRKLIGDLSDGVRVRDYLGLSPAGTAQEGTDAP
jgi:circadian clock protein KaiB